MQVVEQAGQERMLVAAHEKQLKAVVSALQCQTSSLEQAMRDKLDGDHLQQLRGSLSAAEAQLARLERVVGEKADTAQVQPLRASLENIESKIDELEIDRNAAPMACEMQVFQEAFVDLQSKVVRIERSMLEGMDCMQQLERVIANISNIASQSSGMEECMRRKLTSAERSVRESVDARSEDQARLRKLEGSVHAIGAQLGSLQHMAAGATYRSQGNASVVTDSESFDEHSFGFVPPLGKRRIN